jgi:formate hydrogenlyase subunit 4
MILEYSARHLALIEWAVAIKLFTYSALGIALFLPWGIAPTGNYGALPLALLALAVKMAGGGFVLAFMETISAKMRLFRVPEFLGTAFLLAVLGMLIHFLLEV